MKKKKGLILSIVFALAATVVLTFFLSEKKKRSDFEYINRCLQDLQAYYDIDLIFYGASKPPKYCDFEYRIVDEITEGNLWGSNENCYHVVVITDLFTPCDITAGELGLIKKHCEENRLAFLYAGRELRDKMVVSGFWSFYSEGECGFSYSGYNTKPDQLSKEDEENDYLVSCFFDKDTQGNKYEVWRNILWAIAGLIKDDLS